MTPARLLLCLLASAGLAAPTLAQEAAAPAPAAEKTAFTAPPPAPAAKAPKDEPLPPNAPKEDYEFVGWCAGALTGHMMLYDRVKPTLAQISKRWKTETQDEAAYAAQQKAGRDLLEGFADAMRAAEKGSTQALAPRGAQAITLGRSMWANIDTVDENSKAYSWMNWGLPGRCETVAARLKSRGTLMGALLRDNSESAVQTSAVRVVGPRPDAEPAPKPEKSLDQVIAAATQAAPVAGPAIEAPVAAKPATPDATTAAVTAPAPKPAPAKPAAPKPAAVKPAPKPAPAPATNPARAAGLR